MIHKVVATLLFFSFAAHAGPQSLTEAMYIFGRSMLKADMLTMTDDPATVTDQQIGEAVAGLDVAIQTAEESINRCGELLMPAKTSDFSTDKKLDYQKRSINHMTGFIVLLKEYRAALLARDFSVMDLKRGEIQEAVSAAHSAL